LPIKLDFFVVTTGVELNSWRLSLLTLELHLNYQLQISGLKGPNIIGSYLNCTSSKDKIINLSVAQKILVK
jgi:hypothetical protein